MPVLATYILIGIAGGVLSGLFGVGGGIVLIPLMTIFLGMSQHSAQGTSLGIIMFSFITMLVYYKKGFVNLNLVLLIGIGFVIGGFLGAQAAGLIPGAILKKFFAVLMIIVAVRMLFFSK
ncbi:MAG: sulfite exporter TauE/SafE family protein [Endomicrobium sp.]|nr:sulfite exporter TauE/SafE family protein [Endomicrobium sp.]